MAAKVLKTKQQKNKAEMLALLAEAACQSRSNRNLSTMIIDRSLELVASASHGCTQESWPNWKIRLSYIRSIRYWNVYSHSCYDKIFKAADVCQ